MRNWEFARSFVESSDGPKVEIVRVPPHDVSRVFDVCREHALAVPRDIKVVPYGTKSMTVGMGLFAMAFKSLTASDPCRRKCSIEYGQPLVYNDKYSTGVELDVNGKPVIHAFAIKLDGKNLYELPNG